MMMADEREDKHIRDKDQVSQPMLVTIGNQRMNNYITTFVRHC